VNSEERQAEEAKDQDQSEAGKYAPLLAGRGEGHWDIRP